MDTAEGGINDFDRLAEKVANEWFGGMLPRHPDLIAKVLLAITPEVNLPNVPASVLEDAKKRFADCLAEALRDRVAAQDADRSQWRS